MTLLGIAFLRRAGPEYSIVPVTMSRGDKNIAVHMIKSGLAQP
jgi:hypothetical protein